MAIAYRSHSSGTAIDSTSVATTLPSGAAEGDYALLHFAVHQQEVVTTPTNWTLIEGPVSTSGPGTGHRSYLFGRVLPASPAAPTVAIAQGQNVAWAMTCYTGVDTTTPVASDVSAATNNSTSHVSPNITATSTDQRLVSFIHNRSSGALYDYTPPSGFTERYDLDFQPSQGHSWAGADKAAVVETSAHTWTSSSSAYTSMMVALLNPAAAAAANPMRMIV